MRATLTPERQALVNLDKKRDKWIKANVTILATSCVTALSLHTENSRAATHLLHITIIGRSDHRGLPSKFFKLQDAKAITLAEARSIRRTRIDRWEQGIRHFESERERLGNIAAVAVDLYPLPVHIFLIQLERVDGVEPHQDWQRSLRAAINCGYSA
jgi:hypothetical protein